ncbi:MAG TPA: hypothetical protein VF789_08415 [Thermoanaerobaculia bacterium]
MDDPSPIETQLQELELFLLDPDVRKSERVAELRADGFIEFGSSGRIYTKEDVIAALQEASEAILHA